MTAWVYWAEDDEGILLYVGSTSDYLRRLAEHERGSEWYEKADNIGVIRMPDRVTAYEVEHILISTSDPVYNVRGARSYGEHRRRHQAPVLDPDPGQEDGGGVGDHGVEPDAPA